MTNWEVLTDLIRARDVDNLRRLLAKLPPGEDARLVTRLHGEEQQQLLQLLSAEESAMLLQELPTSQAAGLLSSLAVERAAAIVVLFPSNEQADVLAELGHDAQAIIAALPIDAAKRVGHLGAYAPNSAGGLMVAECLTYSDDQRMSDVIDDLRANVLEYSRVHAQYAYVVDAAQRLVGVLRFRDLLLLDPQDSLSQAMTGDPLRVSAHMPLDELLHLFDRHPYVALPVVDAVDRLLGVVLRADTEAAVSELSDRRMLLASGV